MESSAYREGSGGQVVDGDAVEPTDGATDDAVALSHQVGRDRGGAVKGTEDAADGGGVRVGVATGGDGQAEGTAVVPLAPEQSGTDDRRVVQRVDPVVVQRGVDPVERVLG